MILLKLKITKRTSISLEQISNKNIADQTIRNQIKEMNYFLLIRAEWLILPFLIYSKNITLFAIFEFLLK